MRTQSPRTISVYSITAEQPGVSGRQTDGQTDIVISKALAVHFYESLFMPLRWRQAWLEALCFWVVWPSERPKVIFTLTTPGW